VVGEIAGNLLRRGGKKPSRRQEMSQIALVSALRILGSSSGDEFQDFGIGAAQG